MKLTTRQDGGATIVEANLELYDLMNLVTTKFPDVKTTSNRHFIDTELLNPTKKSDFSGGTYEDLFTTPNMEPFKAAKERLERSALMKKVVQKNNTINRRQRFFSEYDGEWDYDRKYEIKAFSNAKKQPSPAKFVDIYCYFNIHCGVGADEITRYGTVLWAMNTVLETAGVNTRVFYVQKALSTGYRDSDRGRIDTEIKILLKEPSKYISPMALAQTLTSNFYRRAIFSLMVHNIEFAGGTHSSGLGRPEWDSKAISFENGILKIYPDVLNSGGTNVEQIILETIEKA